MCGMETNWERLHRIAHERVAHLAIKQSEFEAKGGPSPAWYRRLKTNTGGVTSRNRDQLDMLDTLCAWPQGTSKSIIQEDVTGMGHVLADQEEELKYGDDMRLGPHIRAFQTAIARHLMNLDDATAAQVMRKVAEDLGLDLS